MATLGDYVQHADWRSEKHVPVIDCPDTVPAGELFQVNVTLGKEVAHPNTTEHHIRWIALFFQPQGEKFTYEIGHFAFNAHGESTAGANQGPVYTHHAVNAWMKTNKPGILFSRAYCNIHGLWEDSKEISVTAAAPGQPM
jgi:superoxide reductase